nr:hypothetical protein [uncultured Prevotella sp.]
MRKKSRILLIAAAVVLLLSGCRTTRTIEKQVPVPVYRTQHDTINKIVNHHDSVFELDSVYFKGNTIYKIKYRNKYLLHNDTIYKAKADTIDKPVYLTNTVTKEHKYVPKAYKVSMWFMIIVILLAGGYFGTKIYKKYKAKRV